MRQEWGRHRNRCTPRRPTCWFSVPAELPALVSASQVVPLPESHSDQSETFDLTHFLRPYRTRLMNWRVVNYAVPVLGDSLLFAWRADLLENRNHKKAIEARLKHPLSPDGPNTWQEIEIIAKYFNETAVWIPGDTRTAPCASLPPLPESADESDSAVPCGRGPLSCAAGSATNF